jgi:hypothetical protein
MVMLAPRSARALYISTYVGLIVGIGLSLLITGYDLIQQTLILAQGGGQYFYIFILVGAYVATVLWPPLFRIYMCLDSRAPLLGSLL